MMRSSIAFAALGLTVVGVTAGAQQKVLRGAGTTATVSVRLVAAVASVRVIGWERDSVELSGVVASGARVEFSSGAPAGAAKGMKMYVESPTEAAAREGKLVLRVPRGARVWLKTGSATMEVSGVIGGLDLNVVGGAITVHGNPRELRAESMDGNIVVNGSPEWLRVKTATGDITLQGGQDLGASTISGTIRSTGGEVERAKLEATSGAISFATGLARNASVELETHSGPIDLYLLPNANSDIDAATITGAINNELTTRRPTPGNEGRGMTLSTGTGMGGARVVVRSFKGTVQLHRK